MSQDIFVVIEHLRGQVADISYTMLAAAQDIVKGSDGKVIGLLLGHQCQELAADLSADHVYYFDHVELTDFTSDAYLRVLADVIREKQPRTVLLGSTSIGADIASALSVRLKVPMIALCRSFVGGSRFVSQICGGKIMAEGELPSSTSLVTMIPGSYKPEDGHSSSPPNVTTFPVPDLSGLRVRFKGYIEPEIGDVDICDEPLLIAVGRGVQTEDNIELAQELAELMDGVVCGSRPVVDQGWLPISRLVGKSGKSVKPKLYLAMGISGAPEHVEAVMGSNLIVAVNTDPDAPIFDVAQYGAEVDMLDLMDALIEKVEEFKDG